MKRAKLYPFTLEINGVNVSVKAATWTEALALMLVYCNVSQRAGVYGITWLLELNPTAEEHSYSSFDLNMSVTRGKGE